MLKLSLKCLGQFGLQPIEVFLVAGDADRGHGVALGGGGEALDEGKAGPVSLRGKVEHGAFLDGLDNVRQREEGTNALMDALGVSLKD